MIRIWLLAIALAAFPVLAGAQSPGGTLDKIRASGTIVLGTRDISFPFSYLDENKQPAGYAFDICMRIVDAVKTALQMPQLRVVTMIVTPADRVGAVTGGAVDLECGSTKNNAERRGVVAFTNTHFLAMTRFASKKALALHTLEDLRGKPVAGTVGTADLGHLIDMNTSRQLGIDIQVARNRTEAFQMLATGRAVAVVSDDVLLSSTIANTDDSLSYEISDDALSVAEPYGIMLRRDDPAFKAVADQATSALYRSRDGLALYVKWFQSSVPPRGINLNLPMLPGLRRAFLQPSDSADPASYVVQAAAKH